MPGGYLLQKSSQRTSRFSMYHSIDSSWCYFVILVWRHTDFRHAVALFAVWVWFVCKYFSSSYVCSLGWFLQQGFPRHSTSFQSRNANVLSDDLVNDGEGEWFTANLELCKTAAAEVDKLKSEQIENQKEIMKLQKTQMGSLQETA